VGSRGSARLNRAVPSALESGRVVASGRYRLSLEPVGGLKFNFCLVHLNLII
jgi:hypothetical protein